MCEHIFIRAPPHIITASLDNGTITQDTKGSLCHSWASEAVECSLVSGGSLLPIVEVQAVGMGGWSAWNVTQAG